MLGQRRRRWPDNEPTLCQYLVLSGYKLPFFTVHVVVNHGAFTKKQWIEKNDKFVGRTSPGGNYHGKTERPDSTYRMYHVLYDSYYAIYA